MAIDFRKASADAKAKARIRALGLGGSRTAPKPNASPHPLRGTPLDRSPAPSLPMPSRTPKALTPGSRPKPGGSFNPVASVSKSAKAAGASAAIRNQVAKMSSPAPSPSTSRPAPSRAPSNPAPKATRPGGKPSAPKSSSAGQSNHERKQTFRAKAARSGVKASSFDSATLSRAVKKFTQTHAWARQPGQEAAVRQAAAFLLSKEHGLYNGSRKSKKASALGGPDAPPSGGR